MSLNESKNIRLLYNVRNIDISLKYTRDESAKACIYFEYKDLHYIQKQTKNGSKSKSTRFANYKSNI